MKAVIAIIVVLIIIGGVVFLVTNFGKGGWGFGIGCGNGNGNGSGEGSGVESVSAGEVVSADDISDDEAVTIDVESAETNEVSTRAVIEIRETDIYFNDVLCDDISALEEMILASRSEFTEYEFRYDRAIETVYDGVNNLLGRLQDSLGIVVEYSEE